MGRAKYNPALSSGASHTGRAAYNPSLDTGSTGPHASVHGIGGFFHNLAHGAADAARGFGPGVATAAEAAYENVRHPLRDQNLSMNPLGAWKKNPSDPFEKQIAYPLAHAYAVKYGPALHGDFGKTASNIYADPFGTGLDALTVLTAGAGGTARAGGLLAKTGVISDESRLARLGETKDLTVPDLGKQAGQEGFSGTGSLERGVRVKKRDITIKKSSANPVIRARQVAINKALNNANPRIPIVGSQARLARVVARRALKEGQSLALKSNQFKQAFARLDDTGKAAFHLRARQLDPEAYKALLENGALEAPSGSKLSSEYSRIADRLKQLNALKTKAVDGGSVQAMHEKLATLDKQYNQMIDVLSNHYGHPQIELNDPEAARLEQLKRNTKNGSIRKSQSGKNRTGGASGSIGKYRGSREEPTIRAEIRAHAEQKLDEMIAKHPDRLGGIPDMVAEREELQQKLSDAGELMFTDAPKTIPGLTEAQSIEHDALKSRLATASKEQELRRPEGPLKQAELKGTEKAMYDRLSDPKLNKLFRDGSKKLNDALAKGQELSDLMTHEKVSRGYVDEVAAAERPYLAQRVLHGAEITGKKDVVTEEPSLRTGIQSAYVDRLQKLYERADAKARAAAENVAAKTDAAAIGNRIVGGGVPQRSSAGIAKDGFITGPSRAVLAQHAGRAERLGGALSVAKDRLAQMQEADARRLLRKGGPRARGISDTEGNSVPELAQRLADEERAQPFYVPDSAATAKLPNQSWRPSSGNAPMKMGSGKQNLATLLKKGMINLHGDSLSAEHARFARHVQRSDLNGALAEVAAKEPESGLPKDYSYLKITTGEKGAPYTQRAAADLKDALKSSEDKGSLLERFTTKDPNDEDIRVDGDGHRLIVPDSVAKMLSHEAQSTRGIVSNVLFEKPTSVWKHLVLGLRPAYMANIILSQHILGALQAAPDGHGITAYLNNLIPGARLGKLTDATLEDVMPEQAHGTFASSVGGTSNRGLALKSKAYQGVMPATLAVEGWLRRLMVEGWAKSTPEIQAAMKSNGGDINAAMRAVAKSDPHVIDEISLKVDHAQGNYRSYNAAERKLRAVVPFYGWDRHIVQSTYRILAEHPGRALLINDVGQEGHAINERDFGALPTYLQGLIKIHLPSWMGPVGGRTAGLSTKAINPFSSDADLGETLFSAVHGHAGEHSEEAANVNPLITGLFEQLTGRSSLTGTPLKDNLNYGVANVPVRAAFNVPQMRLLAEILGMHPLGKPKASPASLTDWRTQLGSLLGVPTQQLDLAHEHQIAQLQHTRPK